jgi:hypothetical protein
MRTEFSIVVAIFVKNEVNVVGNPIWTPIITLQKRPVFFWIETGFEITGQLPVLPTIALVVVN